MTGSKSFLLISTILFLSVAPRALLAQQDSLRWRGFAYDDTFRLGSHVLRNASVARNDLRLDFVQLYGGKPGLEYYRNLDSLPADTSLAFLWWHLRRFYDTASRNGLRVIYGPDGIPSLAAGCWAADSWYSYNSDSIQAGSFQQTMYNRWHSDVDEIPQKSIFQVRVPEDTSATVAMGARFTADIWRTIGGWDRLVSRSGTRYADSSRWFSLAVVLGISHSGDRFRNLDSTDTICFLDMMVRDTTGQNWWSNCRCSFYRRWIRLPITKALFLDSARSIPEDTTFRRVLFKLQVPTPATRFAARATTITKRIEGAADLTIDIATTTPFVDFWSVDTAGNPTPSVYGWPQADAQTCQMLYDSLRAIGLLDTTTEIRAYSEGSEITYDVHSTGAVEFTFRHATFAPLFYAAARDGAATHFVDSVMARTLGDAALDTMLMRVGVIDEVNLPKNPAYEVVGSAVQRYINHRADSLDIVDNRGLWSNPMGDLAGARVFAGDLDSSHLKMVHMQAHQNYVFARTPAFYARPNLRYMSDTAINNFYRLDVRDQIILDTNGVPTDTLRHRLILGNTPQDYWYYTKTTAAHLRFQQQRNSAARSVSYERYSLYDSPSYPVYPVIQVHGYVGEGRSQIGPFIFKPPTPEEISAQVWMALNCGMDGIVYSDIAYCGAEIGILNDFKPEKRDEYGADTTGQPWIAPLARMWLGYTTRYNMVRHLSWLLKDTLVPVYWTLDRHAGVRVAMSDPSDDPGRLHMVRSIWTEKAIDSIATYTASGLFDARSETRLEVTSFRPKSDRGAELARGESYLLLSNLRCWPRDFLDASVDSVYDSATVARFDSVAIVDTLADGSRCATKGFGNIDVRRPVAVFENESDIIADSLLIVRIDGQRDSMVVAVGDTVPLHWLEPGWGAMYRIRPLPRSVSQLGTAFPNAVHAMNPSSDSADRDHIVVYERDSVVYMRTMSPSGVWSTEFMVSPPEDTVAGQRRYNITPAVGVSIAGSDTVVSALVVWERRDSVSADSTSSMICARYFFSYPDSSGSRASNMFDLDTTHFAFDDGDGSTPAVVGVDSGYVVAWARPYGGIAVVAVPDARDTLRPAFLSRVGNVVARGTWVQFRGDSVLLDSLCRYPTLAYVKNRQNVFPPVGLARHDVYLAWQQGGYAGPNTVTSYGPFIFFSPVGVSFSSDTSVSVLLDTVGAEHVSRDLPACRFFHPCIAADSLFVGVAFQSPYTLNGGRPNPALIPSPAEDHVIVLRFRDSVTQGGQLLRAWKTPPYIWGGAPMEGFGWPSLGQFPMVSRTDVRSSHPGILTWQQSLGTMQFEPSPLRYLYRFGETVYDTSRHGLWNSVVRVPLVRDPGPAVAGSGVFSRGGVSDRMSARSIFGDSVFYYPAAIENSPVAPSSLFSGTKQLTGRIFAAATFSWLPEAHSPCAIPAYEVGLNIFRGFPIEPWIGIGPGVNGVSVPPSTFFGDPWSVDMVIDGVDKAWRVASTGVFSSNIDVARVEWQASGTGDLAMYLNTQPYDSGRMMPANVVSQLELVRASDSVVLWTSDTVSARTANASVVDRISQLDVDSIAGANVDVFFRIVTWATEGLDVTAVPSFQFIPLPGEIGAKRVGRRDDRRDVPADGAEHLRLAVVPNPVSATSGTIWVRTPDLETPVTLRIHDLLGREVFSHAAGVPKAEVTQYNVDLSEFRGGLYTVSVEQGREIVSERWSVVR